MRIHHLNCGSLCPRGGRLAGGEGGLLSPAPSICHCLLIESSDGLVLVDTGFGTDDARNPAQLGQPFRALMQPRPQVGETALSQVERLGFTAADVRHVVTTHLDLDHSGGLPDFPEAEVHVFAAELAAALQPSLRDRARYIGNHWKHGPRWVEHREQAGGDRWFGFQSVRILPALDVEVALIPLVGHTIGHTGVAINDGSHWFLHCGDAYFNHAEVTEAAAAPPILRAFQRIMAADNGARADNAARLRELAAAHGNEVTLFCSHDPHELEREQTASAALGA
jgi:glyoxylase-like metal-dependent hydrolase (beta-lactamase superfamily II)